MGEIKQMNKEMNKNKTELNFGLLHFKMCLLTDQAKI